MITELLDRSTETAALADALAEVRAGLSGVLVLRGDAGIGKTVLLEWAAGQAADMRLGRVAGLQAETGMGFAGLHQLLVPFLGGLDGLPGPQRQALGSAFGLMDEPAPDRFLIGLAALTLLTDAAAVQPVLCLVDDAQWLDQASVEVLGFMARRLYADRVGMVFTVREGEGHPAALAGLPELVLGGLPEEAAGRLLTVAASGSVDRRVSAQVVAEVAGNPLALVELAEELTAEELSGAVPLGWPLRYGGRLEELYLARVRALPADTRMLLLVAAADPTGDAALVYQAAGRLGAGPEAGEAAAAQRLVTWHPRARFRHPLIRSAAYYAAPPGERRAAHAALAVVTDREAAPDQRAWHLAEAAAGPDEEVAAELEGSAGRAQARGGLAAAATILERAALLTADPARQAGRFLSAAQASMRAGAFGRAQELLAMAEAGPLDELASARADLLRGQIAFSSRYGRDAPALLLKAARRLEPLDLELARDTYLSAWHAAAMARHLAAPGTVVEISRAALALPPADPPRPADLILRGVARLVTDGPAAAAAPLRQAVNALIAGNVSIEEGLRWGWVAASVLWDYEAGYSITSRRIQLARSVGALEQLAPSLSRLAMLHAWAGDFAIAASLIAERRAVGEVIGAHVEPHGSMLFLAALRGDEDELTTLTAVASAAAAATGQGVAATYAHWAAAILHNGFGRYADAFAAAWQVKEQGQRAGGGNRGVSTWVRPELIEAAVRTGRARIAKDALAALAEATQAGGTDFGLGLEARSRAVVAEGTAAEGYYREAIQRLGRTQMRPDLARAHLLYGEWLRRQRRRRDARDQLRTAFEMFDSIGMAAFAARARTELRATGEHARPRDPGISHSLTPQEEQIARLVAESLSNREIAARLFISASTVEYHLRKVFRKLGVSSRNEVAQSFRDGNGTSGQQD